jgi:hypothetical protein
VQLIAGHYDALHFDREYDVYHRDAPSVLAEEAAALHERLAAQQVQYVVLHTPELKARASQMEFLQPRQEIGNWSVYEVRETP